MVREQVLINGVFGEGEKVVVERVGRSVVSGRSTEPTPAGKEYTVRP